jgi:hypothetical protein
MEYIKSNQLNELGAVIDEIVTITDYIPKVTVKSKTELLARKAELTLQLTKIQDEIKFIDEVTKCHTMN